MQAYNIKMHSLSKIRNALKNFPFYSEETKDFKKNSKRFNKAKILSELPFFPKKLKN